MMRARRTTGLDVIRALCLVFAAWPNCTRCCPNGSCEYAWQDCPPGCAACSSSSSSSNGCNGATPGGPSVYALDAGSMTHEFADATVVDDGDATGTLAFVTTASGTFAVVTLRDAARFFRVDANESDEDPLMVRPLGDVLLDGPERVTSHGARALVTLSRGEVAAIDPLALGVVDQQPTCAAPGAIAVGSQTWVSCDPDVHAMVASNGAVAASDGTTWNALEGTLAPPPAPASATDVSVIEDQWAWVDGDDAFFDGAKVNPGMTSRAVALTDVVAEHVTRRVLAVRTSSPSLVVFYAVVGTHLTAGPIEPLR
jgi:hypothetical protein